MNQMTETLDHFAKPEVFIHLQNFDELARANMSRVFLDFEATP